MAMIGWVGVFVMAMVGRVGVVSHGYGWQGVGRDGGG